MAEKRDPQDIMRDARKLHDDRFAERIRVLKQRSDERFNLTTVEVPKAYRKTSLQLVGDNNVRPSSNILADEGRQIATLIYAMPVPHLTPPTPEDQSLTTKIEEFLIAMHQQLEEAYGPVWWQCTAAQVHDNIGWIYFAPKRKPYKGQPKPPKDDADDGEKVDYDVRNERYKRDAGIAAVFDYEYANTATVLYEGNVFDPHCVYVWKEVPASTFKKTYGDMENVTGKAMDSGQKEDTITVVEYWTRNECTIVCESRDETWIDKLRKREKGVVVLDEWKHNWGRVPYFARPCFITEQLDEDKKFEGPLDGIYNEMPYHKRLMAMIAAVAYQTAFSPLKVITKEQGETIVDDTGNMKTFLEFVPGEARQLAPGQDVAPVGQSPEVQNLFLEFAESRRRLEAFMLSPVSKGVSPGADTANAALSNLHRFQLSSLDPMAQQTSRQAMAMYRFALDRIRDMQETVFAFNPKSEAYTSLSASDIVTVNVQAKATPDQGQFQLLIEKHAMELWLSGAITELEFHELRGKENPEQYVVANQVERLRKTLDPVILNQVVNTLGMMDAVNAMIQENATSGDARNAIPGLLAQAGAMQQGQTGMGSGAPGQPRENGVVRQADPSMNTQQAQVLNGGY